MIMKHNYEMGKKAKTAQTKTKRKEKKDKPKSNYGINAHDS